MMTQQKSIVIALVRTFYCRVFHYQQIFVLLQEISETLQKTIKYPDNFITYNGLNHFHRDCLGDAISKKIDKERNRGHYFDGCNLNLVMTERLYSFLSIDRMKILYRKLFPISGCFDIGQYYGLVMQFCCNFLC